MGVACEPGKTPVTLTGMHATGYKGIPGFCAWREGGCSRGDISLEPKVSAGWAAQQRMIARPRQCPMPIRR